MNNFEIGVNVYWLGFWTLVFGIGGFVTLSINCPDIAQAVIVSGSILAVVYLVISVIKKGLEN